MGRLKIAHLLQAAHVLGTWYDPTALEDIEDREQFGHNVLNVSPFDLHLPRTQPTSAPVAVVDVRKLPAAMIPIPPAAGVRLIGLQAPVPTLVDCTCHFRENPFGLVIDILVRNLAGASLRHPTSAGTTLSADESSIGRSSTAATSRKLGATPELVSRVSSPPERCDLPSVARTSGSPVPRPRLLLRIGSR